MTTAHRPTFHAAIGGKEQGGGRYIAGVSRTHVHDLPGQMSLKTRAEGQGTAAELAKQDMRAALEALSLGEEMQLIGRTAVLIALFGSALHHCRLLPPSAGTATSTPAAFSRSAS